MQIAYTVLGDGPIDLVYTNAIWSNLDTLWEEPRWVRYAERLASLSGIAVHIAARVAASAGAGEVVVSQTVKDLVAGSGIEFDDHGVHELKGVPESWRLFAVRR